MSLYPRLIATLTAMQGRVGTYPSLRYSLTQVVHQSERDIDALAPYPPVDVIQQDKNLRINRALDSLAGYLAYSDSLNPERVLSQLRAIGDWIGKRLLPDNCLCCLNGNVPRTVEILTDQHEIPWELATVGGQFLSEVAVHARYPFVARARHSVLSYGSSPSMALIIGNTGALQFARTEADSIASLFQSHCSGKAMVFDHEAVNADLLRDILRGTRYGCFDVIHFIGHGDAQADKVWLELPGCPFLDNDIPPKVGGNPLVFWNACYSASSTSPRYRYQADVIDAFAGRLLSSGASHFIGSLFPIQDATAAHFSTAFYSALFAGVEVGVAFFDAKAAVASQDPLVHTYALYGNPAVRINSHA